MWLVGGMVVLLGRFYRFHSLGHLSKHIIHTHSSSFFNAVDIRGFMHEFLMHMIGFSKKYVIVKVLLIL